MRQLLNARCSRSGILLPDVGRDLGPLDLLLFWERMWPSCLFSCAGRILSTQCFVVTEPVSSPFVEDAKVRKFGTFACPGTATFCDSLGKRRQSEHPELGFGQAVFPLVPSEISGNHRARVRYFWYVWIVFGCIWSWRESWKSKGLGFVERQPFAAECIRILQTLTSWLHGVSRRGGGYCHQGTHEWRD